MRVAYLAGESGGRPIVNLSRGSHALEATELDQSVWVHGEAVSDVVNIGHEYLANHEQLNKYSRQLKRMFSIE